MFGYTNPGIRVWIPQGLLNFVMPAHLDDDQPTWFDAPGTFHGAFSTNPVPDYKSVTWVLNGVSATATSGSTACTPVSLPTEGNGAGPVIVLAVATSFSLVGFVVRQRRG